MRASSQRRQVACALVLMLGLAGSALGQSTAEPTVSTYCRIEAGKQAPPADAVPDLLLPSIVYESFRPLIERNEWAAIGNAMADDFRSSSANIPADLRQKFQHQLDEMKAEMRKVEESSEPAEFVAKAKVVSQNRFSVVQSATEAHTFRLFGQTADAIVINADVDLKVARELCYRAHAAQRVLNRYGQEGREQTATALGYYVTLWDNYNKQGYSQYPWELYLNGLWTLNDTQWTPPRSQWVIAHPAVAIEATWPQARDLRRLDIITVEAIGYLSYTKDRRTYRGASALLTLSASGDPGFGGLVHLGKIGKIGYVYHRRDDVTLKARHGAVFSLDLYKVIGGVPQKLQDAKARVEAVKQALR